MSATLSARQGKDASSGYRPEIEGLRAVASLLVATYHIWLGRVSGGVDVFFVVSALFITTTLLRQVEKTGQVSFTIFWGRLAQRLLPLSMLVLLVVALASIAWFPRPLWDEAIQQTVASALYLQNWQLAFDAVDYLAQGQGASPVQHYWALAVQGQFYLLWPFLVTGAVLVARRRGVPFKTAFAWALTALFVVSMAYSIHATHTNQTFTYFNTFARLWEFCLGAAAALLIPAVNLPKPARVVAGWAGLLGIILCGLIFQVSRVFPGYAALWPTGCALLIILAGTSGSRFGADRLLGAKPMVALGGISYAIYLWHWPILIFYRWFTAQDVVSIPEGVGILGISIALAAITTRLVEDPVRKAAVDLSRRRKLVRFVAAGLAPVLLVSAAWAGYYLDRKEFDSRPISIEHPDYPGARAWEPGYHFHGDPNAPLYPGMLAVKDDVAAIYRDGCSKPDAQWQRTHCIYGARHSKHTLALVGGSHAAHWLPALEPIALRHGWRIVVYNKSNCLFTDVVSTSHVDKKLVPDPWCQKWNADALRILLEDRPEVIFTTSTRGSGPEEHVPDGYLSRWKSLEKAGIRVVAVRDTPWIRFWVPECVEMQGEDDADCNRPTAQMLSRADPVQQLRVRPSNVRFIDMTPYFCNRDQCPPVIGNVIVYRDDSHITAAYARTLAPMLEKRLAVALPPGWM